MAEVYDFRNAGSTGAQPIVLARDSTDDAITRKAAELDYTLDDSTKDALVQYDLNERAAEAGYQRSIRYNEEMYPALVEGLKKAGLNPFLALSSLGGGTLQSGMSNSAGKSAEIANSKRDARSNAARSITTLLAAIAAAIIYAMV